MSSHRFSFIRKSGNSKTGPIPVTYTSSDSCPDVCPLKSSGCYAETGPVSWCWNKLSKAKSSAKNSLDSLCLSISKLPAGTLWRHNVAGDLPQDHGVIDSYALAQIVAANKGKRGFTYTHSDASIRQNREAIQAANADGFTVNLSANNLEHADKLASLAIGPVVTVLPSNQLTNTKTAAGHTVVVCPVVTRENVSCATCTLCAIRDRKVIIGFPAHGVRTKAADLVAIGSRIGE